MRTNSCARRCGDGIVRRDITNFAGGWEECDDGNIVQDDGCTRSCRYSSIADADGYIWDPTSPHGYLYNGTSDAWDGFGEGLRVNNVAYRAGFESADWARQVYTGQVHEMNGFRVTRRFTQRIKRRPQPTQLRALLHPHREPLLSRRLRSIFT